MRQALRKGSSERSFAQRFLRIEASPRRGPYEEILAPRISGGGARSLPSVEATRTTAVDEAVETVPAHAAGAAAKNKRVTGFFRLEL